MAKDKPRYSNGESEFFKRENVCLKGRTLKMFQHEIKETGAKKSTRLFEIIKKHYDNNPPFGW